MQVSKTCNMVGERHGHLEINRKPYMGGPMAPIDLTSSDLERKRSLASLRLLPVFRKGARPYITTKHRKQIIFGESNGIFTFDPHRP